jgi:hypothetical protein
MKEGLLNLSSPSLAKSFSRESLIQIMFKQFCSQFCRDSLLRGA